MGGATQLDDAEMPCDETADTEPQGDYDSARDRSNNIVHIVISQASLKSTGKCTL